LPERACNSGYTSSSRLGELFSLERDLKSLNTHKSLRLDEDSINKNTKSHRDLAWASHSRLSECTRRSTLQNFLLEREVALKTSRFPRDLA